MEWGGVDWAAVAAVVAALALLVSIVTNLDDRRRARRQDRRQDELEKANRNLTERQLQLEEEGLSLERERREEERQHREQEQIRQHTAELRLSVRPPPPSSAEPGRLRMLDDPSALDPVLVVKNVGQGRAYGVRVNFERNYEQVDLPIRRVIEPDQEETQRLHGTYRMLGSLEVTVRWEDDAHTKPLEKTIELDLP